MSGATDAKQIAVVFHAKVDVPKPTAAALMPTRLLAPTEDIIFFASGSDLSLLTPSFPSDAATAAHLLEQQRRADANAASSGSGSLVTGKHVQQRTVSAPIPLDRVAVYPILRVAQPVAAAVVANAKPATATPAPAANASALPIHRFELQSIDVVPDGTPGGYRIAAVDALGHLSVTTLTVATDSKTKKDKATVHRVVTAPPSTPHESGWCGVAFHPTNEQMVVTASHFGRRITVYDISKMTVAAPAPAASSAGAAAAAASTAAAVHTFHTPLLPTQIKFWFPAPAAASSSISTSGSVTFASKPASSISFKTAPTPTPAATAAAAAAAATAASAANAVSPLLIATEGNCVSVWDVRSSGGQYRGCVKLMRPSADVLYSLCVEPAGGNLFAVSGAADIVYVYDARTMQVVSQWAKILKYECVHTAFSSLHNGLAYVTGLDHEIFCGSWRGDKPGASAGGAAAAKQKKKPAKAEDEYDYDDADEYWEEEDGDAEYDDSAAAMTDAAPAANTKSPAPKSSASATAAAPAASRLMDDDDAGGDAALTTLRRHGFRGDSRWIGLDRVISNDTVIGMTETANLYIVRKPYLMNTSLKK